MFFRLADGGWAGIMTFMRHLLVVLLLGFGGLTLRSEIMPVPEDKQAAVALGIIDAYHNPRPAIPPRTLHILYYTPADREPAPEYELRLGAIMEDIHDFYRDGMDRMGFGPRSFAMDRDGSHKLIIRLVKGAEPDASFGVWPGRVGTGSPEGGARVKAACLPALQAAGLGFDHETTLIFCNLADWDEKAATFRHHSPYYGEYDGHHGLCFAADSAILKVDDLPKSGPILHDEEYGDMSLGKFETIFIGGIAHELGHAFALPHCGERWDEKSLGISIMGTGNHTYRNGRRHESPGAFLTMASALRLASHPLFNGSDKNWGAEPQLTQCELTLTTNLTRADLAGRPAVLRVEGTVQGTPPVYGVIAYFDSLHDGGYRAPTATTVPDEQGRFAIEISDLAQCGNGEVRVEFCHANGAVSERRLGFAVTPQAAVDLSQWRLRQGLEPVALAVENGQLNEAQAALAALEKKEPSELQRSIARKLANTLLTEPKPAPSAVSLDLTNMMLGDTQPKQSAVGWLAPAANRLPSNSEIESPLLDCGSLFATGFFAHSPSRYVFDLGGKWKRLRGQGGLQTAMQSYAAGVVFSIKADGTERYRSPVVRGSKMVNYEVDLTGVQTLELMVDQTSAGNACNWALWLDPELSR
jgi:hypothetical protein